MEKPQPLKSLSTQDWETLFDDFQFGGPRRERWLSNHYTGLSLLELALSSILRKDFPINGKLHIIVFLDEFSCLLFGQGDGTDLDSSISEEVLTRLVESLNVIFQAPIDGVSVTYALKEQMMIATTSILITLKLDGEFLDSNSNNVRQLESLTELLLTVINRPNHGPDRQIRAAACECLRQLERAHPCLLSEISGRLWGLCQSERTHTAQSYVLLLTTVIHCILIYKPNVSILNSSITLVPFNVPQFLTGDRGFSSEISDSNHKELRRVMSFLLEWPQILTSCGVMELMSMILPMASALDLQVSLLKVQFWGLLHTYDPLLWHTYLTLFSHFLLAFDGQESEIAIRLISISRESQHLLAFRLLSLEWLIGFIVLLKEEGKGKAIMMKMSSNFYPAVYDPLALKLMKLDLFAYFFILCHDSKSKDTEASLSPDHVNSSASVVKLFEDGFISVSSLKWLPAWSSETAVAFRYFHKFLIGSSSHSGVDLFPSRNLTESTIFCNLQKKLVALAMESKGLVPVIVALITRLTICHRHHWLGKHLLQTIDRDLLPKLRVDYHLTSYFPILNEIAKNVTISPCGLINVLTRYVIFLIEKYGPDTGLRSWSHGSKVLDICRTMLVHQKGSRIFLKLYRLLAFTCLCFPDLEVRDDARIYLRMLVCIPGKKLKLILNNGVQHIDIASSTQPGSYFNLHSPRVSHDPKKSSTLSSYVHIQRTIPLLVTQLWSLSLLSFGATDGETRSLFEGIKEIELPDDKTELDGTSDEIITIPLEVKTIDYPGMPLRVMDSKISRIIETLRRHFSSIPDFKCDPGLKVTIPCTLKFSSEPFNLIWGVDIPVNDVEEPAMYAIVVTFSSSAPYGTIPSCHIPFLTGLSIGKDEGEPIIIELEPREPVPGLIDVSLEANTENGEIIRGRLENITVGMEDMFLQATIPFDLPNEEDSVSEYHLELFNALWEACGSTSNTGREAFPLKGGKSMVAINGTESVKLMEVPVTSLVRAVEDYLARFVVSISGEFLTGIIKAAGGILADVFLEDMSCSSSPGGGGGYELESSKGTLFLKYTVEEEEEEEKETGKYAMVSKKDVGMLKIMMFLPPRYHLLFQMEVSDKSTLVRIRTDHWPCLAYIDDYLEALFLC